MQYIDLFLVANSYFRTDENSRIKGVYSKMVLRGFILVVVTLFTTQSGYADWAGEYRFIHGITMANSDKQYRVENVEDTLSFKNISFKETELKKGASKTWDFNLFAVARSANMCDVSGDAIQISPDTLEYKTGDCTLQFQKKGSDIHVSDVGEQCEKSCGRGVYLDGLVFSPKPKKPPKPRQSTSLKPLSDKALASLKGDWKAAIQTAYRHRSTLFDGIDLDKLTWHRSKIKNNKYYLFAKDQPFFIIVNHHQKKRWQLINIWKIQYPEKNPQDDQQWAIYPALYPVSDNQDAIALTYHFSESYSGGGAGFELATIIPLEASTSVLDASQALIDVMPFSCTALIRACFSQEDVDKSVDEKGKNRCHDDSSGYLALKTQRASSAGDHGYYQWRLTWYERFLKGASQEPMKKTKQRVLVDLNSQSPKNCETFEKFNFCGGGTESHCHSLQ